MSRTIPSFGSKATIGWPTGANTPFPTIVPSGMTIEPSGSTFTGPAGTGAITPPFASPPMTWNRRVTPGSGWPMIAAMIVQVPPVPVPVGHRTSRSATNGLNQSRPSGASFVCWTCDPSGSATVCVPPVADMKTYTNDAPTVIARTTA